MSVIISNVAVIVHNVLSVWSKWDYLAAFRVNLADHVLSFNSGGLGMFESKRDIFFKSTVSFFFSCSMLDS